MNLHALKYFLEVARCLNFSQAARNLHISQPGLSQQITLLEQKLNIKLLIRNTRNVKLTKEGEYLYNNLLPSFDNIESTISELESSGSIPQKKIKIATVPSAASNLIPKLLNKLRKKFGNIEFYVQETSSTQVIDFIKNKEYDIGFFRTPAGVQEALDGRLKILEFSRHPVQLVISVNHPASCMKSVDLYDFKDETFLHYDPEKSPSLHTTLEQACLTAGFLPKTMGSGPELLTIANLISNDIGVTLMPTDMINLLPSHQIKGIDINGQSLYSSISAVWSENYYIPPMTSYAIDILKELSIRPEAHLRKQRLLETQ